MALSLRLEAFIRLHVTQNKVLIQLIIVTKILGLKNPDKL